MGRYRTKSGRSNLGLPAILVVAVGFILLFGAVAPSPVSAEPAGGSPTVRANAVQAALGGQTTASVSVVNVPAAGVGSWTVDVSYNSSVVSLVNCRGSFGGGCTATFGPQTARIFGATASGIFGSGELGTLTFRCNALGTSTLGVSVSLLADASLGDPQEYSPGTAPGSVTCVQPAPPTNTPRPPATNTPRPNVLATDTPRPNVPAADTPAPGQPTDTPAPGQPAATSDAGEGTPTAGEGTPSSTPEPNTTPSPTLTSEVLGAVTPGSSSGGGSVDQAVDVPSLDRASAVRPQTTSAVMRFGDVSTDARVIATNIVLAIILLCILLAASALFNDTIDLNRDELSRRMDWLMRPLHVIGGAINWVADTIRIPERLQRILAPIGIMVLTALIYSFNEPVDFSERGLLLFASLIISIGVLTYVFEGGMAIMTRSRYRVPAGVKIFPLAIVIAIGFVTLSRLVNFEAPIMFGFVAVATVLAATKLRDDQEATTAAIPATILLLTALGAWALLGPLRDVASDSESWLASLPSESAAMIFAGGIEGVLFAMIPVQFSDGYPIWRRLRWVWAGLAFVSAFVFSWVLLNPAAREFDALMQGRVLTAIGLTLAYAGAVVLIWGYFYLKSRNAGPAQVASAG